MKTSQLVSGLVLSLFCSIQASAQDPVPTEFLAQAMIDRAESIVKIKQQCNNGVRSLKSEKIEDALYRYTFTLVRQFRGQAGKDCKVEITQDFLPNAYDGPTAYEVVVTELK